MKMKVGNFRRIKIVNSPMGQKYPSSHSVHEELTDRYVE